jgi:hypothetical protein
VFQRTVGDTILYPVVSATVEFFCAPEFVAGSIVADATWKNIRASRGLMVFEEIMQPSDSV